MIGDGDKYASKSDIGICSYSYSTLEFRLDRSCHSRGSRRANDKRILWKMLDDFNSVSHFVFRVTQRDSRCSDAKSVVPVSCCINRFVYNNIIQLQKIAYLLQFENFFNKHLILPYSIVLRSIICQPYNYYQRSSIS